MVSANEYPTEKIPQFVGFFLKPPIPNIESYLRNTSHFIMEIGPLGWILNGMSTQTRNQTLIEPLELTFKCNKFQFNGENLLQFGGGGVNHGNQGGIKFGQCFMADFEEKYVYSYIKQPIFYRSF